MIELLEKLATELANAKPVVSENGNQIFDIDGLKIELKENGDSISITLTHNDLAEDFKKWCDKLPDDVFVEACEQIENMKEFTEDITEEKICLFKNLVVNLIKKHIKDYQNLLETL